MDWFQLSKNDRFRIWAIFLSLCIITVVHYLASAHEVFWHEIFQRAYYLPVIAAALWYGLRGGLLTAGLAALFYLPHVFFNWHGFPTYQFNQYAESVLFFVFGGITGALSDQQRLQRKKLEETSHRLSKAYADLQNSFESLRRAERLSALGHLSAGLAHEIRNPLSAIEGAVDILTRPALEPEQREEFAALIKKELAHLNGMLDHFLTFARPQPPHRKPTAVGTLLEEVCNLVSQSVASNKVRCRCPDLDSSCALVSLDPDQIKEVILNLVINANESMPAGGLVELQAAKQGSFVAIRVKDEGVGILDEDLERIFDPFYSTKPNGTGLGLSIAHQIMEQHGGRIEARRNPDRGMTFSLYLPVNESAADKG